MRNFAPIAAPKGRARQCFATLLSLALVLTSTPSAPAAAQRPAASRPAALAAKIDGVVRREMESGHVPGTVVVVVKDGRVVFERGYGVGNVETKTPVDPARTIFRIGSISKVFTATALVQLADRNRIRLDRDVNAYLRSVRVPATYAEPIKVSDLLTHTSGLDEISLGRKTSRAEEVIPLGEFLRTRLVRRQPPHRLISYGTYGISLAGLLVEDVSGRDFRDYLRAEIFRPLRMSRTTIGAVPAAQQRDLAIGYAWADGQHRPEAFEYFHTYPGSDINSTARDMARFMLFHLEGGGAGRRAILSEGARRTMHRQHFANHPRLPGMAHGFYEIRRNGIRGIEHGGVMDGYSSLLYLAPDERLGIFVASNSQGESLRAAVRNAVLDHFQPRPEPRGPDAALVAGATDRFAGRYQRDEYCHSCPAGAAGYRPPSLTVESIEGGIRVYGARWVQVEPLLFQLTRGQMDTGDTQLAFRQDREGKITHLLIGHWTYERVPEIAAVSVPANVLAEYVGTYEIAPNQTVVVTLESGKLTGRMTGYPVVELTATSETSFVGAGGDAVITFFRGPDNRLSHLILQFGGRDLRAIRKP